MSTKEDGSGSGNGILTVESIPMYLEEHREEVGVFDVGAKLVATSITGGNVNFAFVVKDDGGKSVFVKQAPEYVAIFGPDGFPLTSERMQREVDVYDEWRTILGTDQQQPSYIPQIYMFDRKRMVFVMEFLDGYSLLDHILVDATTAQLSPNVAKRLGEFMGKTHAATHSSKVSNERLEYLNQHFLNRPMRDIQLEFVFTKCYKEATDEQREGLIVDEAFQQQIQTLKRQYDYSNTDTHNLVLSHGDLHPGSVMVQMETGDAKIIDPEFTIYGPPGLDVGSLLSGYVLAAVHQKYSSSSDEVLLSICDGMESIWTHYCAALEQANIDPNIVHEIEVQTVGFTVAEVCRTAMEFAGGRKWLQFPNQPSIQAQAKKAALTIVQNCMVQRHQGGMKLLLSQVKSLL